MGDLKDDIIQECL